MSPVKILPIPKAQLPGTPSKISKLRPATSPYPVKPESGSGKISKYEQARIRKY